MTLDRAEKAPSWHWGAVFKSTLSCTCCVTWQIYSISVIKCPNFKMGMTIPMRKHMGKPFVNANILTNVLLTHKND